MNDKNKKKIFILKAQLTSAVFLLIIALISGFFIFGPKLTEIAKALTGDYNKAANGSLDASAWNNLDDDFVAKSGDVMAGVLNMGGKFITNLRDPSNPGDAATMQYVDSKFTNKIVCGRTSPVSTAWQYYDEVTIYVDVTIPAMTFSGTPFYIISLGGNSNHYRVYGANSVYIPSSTGFRVYVTRLSQGSAAGQAVNLEALTASEARNWQWHINWCGWE